MIRLSGISWKTSETLLEELSDRRFRLPYNRGNLEIMALDLEHEQNKRVFGSYVATQTSQFFINLSTPDIASWLLESIRLTAAGLDISQEFLVSEPELALYEYLQHDRDDAYSYYNALLNSLNSFCAALELKSKY